MAEFETEAKSHRRDAVRANHELMNVFGGAKEVPAFDRIKISLGSIIRAR